MKQQTESYCEKQVALETIEIARLTTILVDALNEAKVLMKKYESTGEVNIEKIDIIQKLINSTGDALEEICNKPISDYFN